MFTLYLKTFAGSVTKREFSSLSEAFAQSEVAEYTNDDAGKPVFLSGLLLGRDGCVEQSFGPSMSHEELRDALRAGMTEEEAIRANEAAEYEAWLTELRASGQQSVEHLEAQGIEVSFSLSAPVGDDAEWSAWCFDHLAPALALAEEMQIGRAVRAWLIVDERTGEHVASWRDAEPRRVLLAEYATDRTHADDEIARLCERIDDLESEIGVRDHDARVYMEDTGAMIAALRVENEQIAQAYYDLQAENLGLRRLVEAQRAEIDLLKNVEISIW